MLPRTLDDLRGLRAARWVRESTAGQYDAFGPESQREQQDRAIERYGLIDTGLAWHVAHSGRTVGSTSQFAEMMAAAGIQYDVLIVGYVSRFARDLRTAVNARHDLHRAGAAILFADERILTSDEDAWDSWAREAVEAESYSRKLARRIREGYAAKRRRLGEPGGRPPMGYLRKGRPPRLLVAPSDMRRVRRAYESAAKGMADREVAGLVGVSLDTIRSTLTNPIYIGELRDGSPASVQPVIDRATWDRVQALRRARNARGGRPAVSRTYALPMLRCASCGRRLIGDTGRYRHLDPCPEFAAARRKTAFRNRLVRSRGYSQPAELYERCIPVALQAVSLEASSLVIGAEVYGSMQQHVDDVGLRRIQRDRERALTRYAVDRDIPALEATMSRLDADEARMRTLVDDRPDWSEVLRLLRDLPALWSEADPPDRRQLAEQTFASVDALGARQLTITFHCGVQAVVMVGARGLDPTVTSIRTPWRDSQAETAC